MDFYKESRKGERVCPRPESNQRHADFQSAALPTELPGHRSKRRGNGYHAGETMTRVSGR